METINTLAKLQELFETFKTDLANDGHPNVSKEFFLQVVLDDESMYDIDKHAILAEMLK